MDDKLDELIETLARAKEAQDLLERVWQWTDPYGTRVESTPMPKDLVKDLQQYFNYDDSE